MQFSYGDGEYVEGQKVIQGQIILSEHKLFLKGPQGDLTETYIPLEKIERITKTAKAVHVYVRLALARRYVALIKGDRKRMDELVKDIVSQRGFKKKFLKNEWFETT